MDNIEKHQKALLHLEEAAKNHNEALRHHKDGNPNKAYYSTLRAFGYCSLAFEVQKENLKEYEAMF